MNHRRTNPAIVSLAILAFGLPIGCSMHSGDTSIKQSDDRSIMVSGEVKEITTVEGITEYALPNGLKVLLFPDKSKPTVTINITYLVGSRHEGRGEAGMAHLLEHMVFKGTPTFENIWGALEDHGARFNGTTWVDRTNYYETLPATDENLEFALHMEADRMVNSVIDGDELAKEMTVVRNEFEMGENNPVGVLSERMMSSAYLWHNYGKSTIGNRSDIERVPVENLRRFYERNYQPDNAMLVVAGKFDIEKTLGLINKYFGAIPRPTRTLEATYTEEPVQDGPRFVKLERVGDVAAAGLIYHVPAGSHADFAAVQILEDVLTARPSGKLYKALVEPGLASSVRGSAWAWAEPGVIEIMAEIRLDQDAEAVLAKMTETVEAVAANGITDTEVNRIKRRRLKNIKLSMTNSGRIGVQLSEWAALGDWRMFFIHRDRIKNVTTADVQRVAKTYLLASNRTAGLFVPMQKPTRAPIPATPNVEQIVSGYTGVEAIEQGEVFEATTQNIDARTRRFEIRPGLKVAMLAKETRGDSVQANFRFHFGDEASLTAHTTALGMIPTLMMRGTKERDFQGLRDEIDRLQARISVRGGTGSFSARIETDRAHIVEAIELVGEILRKPAFSSDEFATSIKERLARQEESLSDPQARGFNILGRSMSPWPKDSIHYVPTLEEGIARTKAVSLGSISDLYARFYGASNAEVSVVGDFDETAVTKCIKSVFGSWQSPASYDRIVKPYRSIESQDKTILTPDKKMAVVGMGTVFNMRDNDPDYPAVRFANYIFGQSAKSRLLNRLRHKDGLSYSAGAFLRIGSQNNSASLIGYAICAPENAVKAQDAIREEMQLWIAEGITEEELTAGKQSYAQKFDARLANDRFVVGELASGLEINRTFAFHTDQMEQIEQLTVGDIKAALQRHLGSAAFVEMKAGDLEPYAP